MEAEVALHVHETFRSKRDGSVPLFSTVLFDCLLFFIVYLEVWWINLFIHVLVQFDLERDLFCISDDRRSGFILEASVPFDTTDCVDNEESSSEDPVFHNNLPVWLVTVAVDKVLDFDWDIDEVTVVINQVHLIEEVSLRWELRLLKQLVQIV